MNDKQNKELDYLFKKRKELKIKHDDKSKEELKKVEEELANRCANDNYEKIKDEIEGVKCEEGGVNSGKLWKLRKKLFPNSRDPPTAMMDQAGNLITDPDQIQNIALETYKNRLRNRTMKEEFKDIQKEKEELCTKG